jgi:uncharacterized membrane protein (DUF4010 family)
MELLEIFKKLGIALGLGLLVGLQRERTDARLAGFRTFPLITLLGALSGLLGRDFGGWIIGLGLVGLAAIIVVGNLEALRTKTEASGVTSEAALLVMYAVGAYLMLGHNSVAIAVGGTVAVLLHLKPEMHALAAKIGDRDFKAIMQFVLISLVILPILPNEYYGPYRVLNPFKIWLMVVLIVGISLGGYILYKALGPRAGPWIGGALGGLISSTATTVSYSRQSKETPNCDVLAAFIILVASAIVFVRVLMLVGATAPGFLRDVAGPMGVMFGSIAILSLWSWMTNRSEAALMPEQSNPTELKPRSSSRCSSASSSSALPPQRTPLGRAVFMSWRSFPGWPTWMPSRFRSRNCSTGGPRSATGWRLILVAAMANLVFKAAIVAMMGSRKLLARISVPFAIALAVGACSSFCGRVVIIRNRPATCTLKSARAARTDRGIRTILPNAPAPSTACEPSLPPSVGIHDRPQVATCRFQASAQRGMDAGELRGGCVEEHHRADIPVAAHQIARGDLHLAAAADDNNPAVPASSGRSLPRFTLASISRMISMPRPPVSAIARSR